MSVILLKWAAVAEQPSPSVLIRDVMDFFLFFKRRGRQNRHQGRQIPGLPKFSSGSPFLIGLFPSRRAPCTISIVLRPLNWTRQAADTPLPPSLPPLSAAAPVLSLSPPSSCHSVHPNKLSLLFLSLRAHENPSSSHENPLPFFLGR